MQIRPSHWLIGLRASVVGAIGFTLGVIGHVFADGLLPGPMTLLGLLAFAVLVAVPMLVRPAGRLLIVALVVGSQAIVHLLLTLTAGHTGEGGAVHGPPADVRSWVAHLLQDAHEHGWMMAAHAGAAAVVGLWLARGERCLWTILVLVGRRLRLRFVVIPGVMALPARVSARTTAELPALRSSVWDALSVARRGPPARVATA
ncbi:hypothetical protein GCM10009547_23720 [Sporichthya brevicatena]|uniref:MFS transporter n=1 Tax=Sporichthya brevicatena TaxID=171442 RepID=A0ABN1GV04_9ACTN